MPGPHSEQYVNLFLIIRVDRGAQLIMTDRTSWEWVAKRLAGLLVAKRLAGLLVARPLVEQVVNRRGKNLPRESHDTVLPHVLRGGARSVWRDTGPGKPIGITGNDRRGNRDGLGGGGTGDCGGKTGRHRG